MNLTTFFNSENLHIPKIILTFAFRIDKIKNGMIKKVFEIGNKSLKQHPEFFRFLKEKGVYDKWVKNRTDFVSRIFAEHSIYPYLSRDKMIPTDDLLCYTQSSFSWSSTTEGHEFWNNLNHEWRKYIDKNS